jgi:hypothetical protein
MRMRDTVFPKGLSVTTQTVAEVRNLNHLNGIVTVGYPDAVIDHRGVYYKSSTAYQITEGFLECIKYLMINRAASRKQISDPLASTIRLCGSFGISPGFCSYQLKIVIVEGSIVRSRLTTRQ